MKLTKKHYDSIQMMVEGVNTVEIARRLDFNRSSIYAWLKDTNFSRELRQQMQRYAHFKLLLALPHIETAVNTLIDIMRSEDCKPSDRIAASKEILALSTTALDQSLLVEVQELQSQLSGVSE